jgi:lysozyme
VINHVPFAVDLFSGDRVEDFARAKAAGVELVIHKASEGQSWDDPKYAVRRASARAAGLLFAAYHFGTGAPVAAQVDKFLSIVLPDEDPTLRLVLDWEVASMSVDAAKAFLAAVDARTGKRTILYSFAAFLTGRLGTTRDAELGAHPLWLAAWRDSAVAPTPQASWDRVLLWQYAADHAGGWPRTVDGIPGDAAGALDLNTMPGLTASEFRSAWLAGTPAPAAAPATPTPEPPHDWASSQAHLRARGFYDGVIDGNPGPKTERAVAAFIAAHPG